MTALNRTSLLALLALSHSSKHGYEISKYIDEKSSGMFTMPFGSLYPVLHKLEKQNFIQATWDKSTGKKPKKIYSITTAGQKVLTDEISNYRKETKTILSMVPAALG